MGCVFCTLFEEKCILVSTAFRIACLRRFFSLVVILPPPYPSRIARHLSQAGNALVWEKRYSRISDYTDFSRRLRFCMPVE